MAVYPLGALATTRRSRYLFQFESADGTLLARTSQAGTYARPDTQSVGVIDSNGVYGPALPNQPRFIAVDSDGDGLPDAAALLLEAAATNLVSNPTALATAPWAASGTTTATNAVATYAGVSFSRISNANGGVLEQPVTYTTDGTKAYQMLIRRDTGNGTFNIGIVDVAGGSFNRGLITGTINADGSISGVSASVGTLLEVRALSGGVYRIIGQATGVLHAGSNRFYADFGGGTATSYLASVCQTNDSPVPSSLILTGARAGETLTFPFAAPVQTSTWYVKFVERGTLAATTSPGLIGIGASTNLAFFILNDGGVYKALLRGASDVTSSVAPAPAYGQLVELRAVLAIDAVGNATVQLGQSIAEGTESLGSVSSPLALGANPAWHDATLTLNDRGGAPGYAALLAARISSGVQSQSSMRRTS